MILVAAFFTALIVSMLYPISLHPGSMLFDRADSSIFTWIISWDIEKFLAGTRGFFSPNIFWPYPDVFMDHTISCALLAAPVYLLTRNPVLAWNTVVICSFIFCGLGAYLLAFRFTPSRSAALVAGIIFAYCPWRYAHIPHPLLSIQWLPFTLLFLHRTLDNPRWRDALLFGFFFTLQALCSFYLAAMTGIAALTVFVSELAVRKLRVPTGAWIRLSVAGILSLALIAPAMMPYFRVAKAQGFKRSELVVRQLSSDPRDYLMAPPWNRLYKNSSVVFHNPYSPSQLENWRFPGALAAALVLLGLWLGMSNTDASRGSSGFLGRGKLAAGQSIYLALAVTAFILSLGPKLHFWGSEVGGKKLPLYLPYEYLYRYLPGFGALRSPNRFAFIFMMAVAVLAAFGLAALEKKIKGRAGRAALASVFVCGIVAEYFSSPVPHQDVPRREFIPEVYKWLAKQPPDAVIAELPQYTYWPSLIDGYYAPPGFGAYDPLGFAYMYYSIFHNFQPTINGPTGYIPPSRPFIWNVMLDFPSPESINLLRYLAVQLVVVHTGSYPGDDGKTLAQKADALESDLKLEGVFGPDRVYRVLNPGAKDGLGKLDRLRIASAHLPARIRLGSDADFCLELKAGGEWPVMSFRLIEANAMVTERSGQGSRSFKRSDKFDIEVLPGKSQWVCMLLPAPSRPGAYQWDVSVEVPESPQVNSTFSFNLEAGNFPDSAHPGTLQAEFLQVSVPAAVFINQEFMVKTRVKNTGDSLWLASDRGELVPGVVHMGSRGFYSTGKKPFAGCRPPLERGMLPHSVAPGEEVEIVLRAQAPGVPGQYLLPLDMVDEWVQWFLKTDVTRVWPPIQVKAEPKWMLPGNRTNPGFPNEYRDRD